MTIVVRESKHIFKVEFHWMDETRLWQADDLDALRGKVMIHLDDWFGVGQRLKFYTTADPNKLTGCICDADGTKTDASLTITRVR